MSEAGAAIDTGSAGGDAGGAGDAGAGGTQVMPSQAALKGQAANDNAVDGDDGAEPGKAAAPKAQKFKLKRLGKDVEADLETLQRMASDDWEEPVTVGGQERKARYQDLVRGYQMSEGSFDRMRKAAEIEKQWAERMDFGKKDPGWFLETQFGVEDHEDWAHHVILKKIERDKKLKELYEAGDMYGFNKLTQDIAAERNKRKDTFKQAQEAAIKRQQDMAEQRKKTQASVEAAFKAGGVPLNDATKAIAGRIYGEYSEIGHDLPHDHLAAMVRDEYVKLVNSYLDQLDDDGLLGFLGDNRRKKLRELEVQKMNSGGKKPAPKPEQKPQPKRENGKPAGITAAQFLKG